MIFSRWRPDKGGYDYFDSPSTRYGLANDLPVPDLTNTSPIGVASTDIGRPMPSDAIFVGSGPDARGMIAPMDTSTLSGVDLLTSATGKLVLAVAAALGVGYFVGRKKRR